MLFHTQQAPLNEGFHIKYNSWYDLREMIINKIIILCKSLTAQLYVLETAAGHLLLKTVTGMGSLSVLWHDVWSDKGSIKAAAHCILIVVF